jgi:ribosomal protein S18 acetylase RimI-like enzyme
MTGADYAIVDGAQASAADRRRMATLLFSTSYLEYCSAANKLGIPCVDLQQRTNIEPFLAHLRVLADPARRLAGFYVAATQAEFAGIATGRPYRDEMQALDDAYEAFVGAHTRPDDFFVASLAIEPRDRGRGLFHRLFDDILARARAAGSPRVVLAVWDSNAALALYRNKGMRALARFDTAWPLFFDRLWLLALPLADSPATRASRELAQGAPA